MGYTTKLEDNKIYDDLLNYINKQTGWILVDNKTIKNDRFNIFFNDNRNVEITIDTKVIKIPLDYIESNHYWLIELFTLLFQSSNVTSNKEAEKIAELNYFINKEYIK
jgi:hypothetical protein